jgi:hypothetical protein
VEQLCGGLAACAPQQVTSLHLSLGFTKAKEKELQRASAALAALAALTINLSTCMMNVRPHNHSRLESLSLACQFCQTLPLPVLPGRGGCNAHVDCRGAAPVAPASAPQPGRSPPLWIAHFQAQAPATSGPLSPASSPSTLSTSGCQPASQPWRSSPACAFLSLRGSSRAQLVRRWAAGLPAAVLPAAEVIVLALAETSPLLEELDVSQTPAPAGQQQRAAARESFAVLLVQRNLRPSK